MPADWTLAHGQAFKVLLLPANKELGSWQTLCNAFQPPLELETLFEWFQGNRKPTPRAEDLARFLKFSGLAELHEYLNGIIGNNPPLNDYSAISKQIQNSAPKLPSPTDTKNLLVDEAISNRILSGDPKKLPSLYECIRASQIDTPTGLTKDIRSPKSPQLFNHYFQFGAVLHITF